MTQTQTVSDDSTDLQTEPETQSVIYDEEYAEDWTRLREIASNVESFNASESDVSDDVLEAADELGLISCNLSSLFGGDDVYYDF